MVFDHAGRYLYISTSDGLVEPYNLSTGQLEPVYYAGKALWGIDITPDDSFLLAAENNTANSQGTFHKIDLHTGAITDINYPLTNGEGGAWDVAIGANGIALVTTSRPVTGSGVVPLRQIDLATNSVTIRNDVTPVTP